MVKCQSRCFSSRLLYTRFCPALFFFFLTLLQIASFDPFCAHSKINNLTNTNVQGIECLCFFVFLLSPSLYPRRCAGTVLILLHERFPPLLPLIPSL